MASALLNQKEELSPALLEVLQQTLIGLGVPHEKTLEIVNLGRESQAKLSDGDREQLCYNTFQSLWNKHFQPFNQMEGVTKKVVLIQSIARRFLARRKLLSVFGQTSQFSETKLWRRLEVIKDILNSERICMQFLKSLKVYKSELKPHKFDCYDTLFTHVDKLSKLHKKILEVMLNLMGDMWDYNFQGVATALLQLIPKFSIYNDFVKSFKRAIDLLDNEVKKNPEFVEKLEEIREKYRIENTLRELYFLPLFRISQYSAQLQSLASQFSEDRVESMSLLQSSSVFYQLSNYLQHTLQEIDRNETLFSVQQKISTKNARFYLADSKKRTFIKDTEVAIDNQKRYLFSFTDALLICRKSSKGVFKTVHDLIYLSNVAIQPSKQNPFELTLIIKGEKLIVNFHSESERDEFADVLSFQIEEIDNKIFGYSLEEIQHVRRCKDGIPYAIRDVIQYLEENALGIENIFSEQPDSMTLARVRHQIDSGDFSIGGKHDPYAVAFALKEYLYEQPEPLISPEMFDLAATNPDFISARIIITHISPVGKDFVELLMALFWRILSCSRLNQYSVEQLAIEFGALLFKPKEPSVYSVLASPKITKVMSLLIQYYCKLFDQLHCTTIFDCKYSQFRKGNAPAQNGEPTSARGRSGSRAPTPSVRMTFNFSMNAPSNSAFQRPQYKMGKLPFPGVRMNWNETFYFYTEHTESPKITISASPFPGIRLHDETAKVAAAPRKLQTRVLSKAKLKDVISKKKEVKEEDRKPELPKSTSSRKIKEKTPLAASSPFPGIRHHTIAGVTASASPKLASSSKLLTEEEEAFFKAHPAAFEVGKTVADSRASVDVPSPSQRKSAEKTKLKRGSINITWRFSAGGKHKDKDKDKDSSK